MFRLRWNWFESKRTRTKWIKSARLYLILFMIMMILWSSFLQNVTNLQNLNQDNSMKRIPPGCRQFLNPYPLENLSDIFREMVELGSTDTKPINTIYNDYRSLYSRRCKVETELIIIVKSYAGHFNQRHAIRNTWGSIKDESVQIVFLLGVSNKFKETVHNEFNTYLDIIQGSFMDVYKHNIFKTHMAYDWVVKNCSQVEWAFFVDDDYFVNIQNIQKFIIGKVNMKRNSMFGYKMCNEIPIRSKDSKNGKWFISTKEYPYMTIPPFLSGGSILTHISVVRKVRFVLPFCKRIWLDDVFISLVATKLRIDLIHEPKFINGIVREYDVKNSFSIHRYNTPKSLYEGWINLHDENMIQRT